MKRVYIIHGWDGSPEEPMLQWLKTEYEKKGYEVTVPAMPDSSVPKIESWVKKLKDIIRPDKEVILIGHSIGCQAILRYLETLPTGIVFTSVILIAPWMALDMRTIEEEGGRGVEIARPWMETPIDFPKVRFHIRKAVAIFSDDDPYVPLDQKEIFEKELGAEIFIEHAKGHFTASDGVSELPIALR